MSNRRSSLTTYQEEATDIVDWILILSIPIIAISIILYFATQKDGLSIPPSLDFTGGVRLEYQINEKDAIRKGIENTNDQRTAIERIQELFLFRLRNFDLSEIIVKPIGDNRLLIEVPGTQAIERAKGEIGSPAVLTFRLVVGDPIAADEFSRLSEETQQKYFLYKGTDFYLEVSEPIFDVSGIDYHQTRMLISQDKLKPYVLIALNPGADKTFAEMTTKYYDQRIAICLDDVIVSAPRVADREISEPTITGDFTESEASDLAKILRSGPMPVSLDLVSETLTSPSLGQENLRRGLIGIAFGFAFFVLIFVLAYADHLAMLVTAAICVALEAAFIFIFARMGWLTLNMITLAGLTVLLGMTVDNLILVFEEFRSRQLREQAIRREHLLRELRSAFKDEAGIVVFANVITVVALVPLLKLEGPIRDLVTVMVLGTFITLIITVWYARQLITTREFLLPLDNASPSHKSRLQIRFDLFKLNRPFLILYIVAIAVSIISLKTQGLDFGLDLKGGTEISLFSSEGIGTDNLRAIASEYFGERVEVKRLSSNLGNTDVFEYVVWIPEQLQNESGHDTANTNISAEGFVNSLQDNLPTQVSLGSIKLLGSTVLGLNLRTVLIYVGVGIFFIIIFIGFNYGLSYSIPVLLATFLDGVIIIGAISLFHVPLSIPVIGTVLTILSYSTNDSIVLCGHIVREFKNDEITRRLKVMSLKDELPKVVENPNAFTNEYFSKILKDLSLRVLLTSLTTVVAAAALWITGEGILRDFGLIVTIGITVGTFSSVSLVAGWLKSIEKQHIHDQAKSLFANGSKRSHNDDLPDRF